MIIAKIIRTDEKADLYGEIAFSGEFSCSSPAQIILFLSQIADNCMLVGSYRLTVERVA